MMDFTTEDIICLHLQKQGIRGGKAPYGASVSGIGDALNLGNENMAERIELLSTLSNMKNKGLLVEDVKPVEGLVDERKVYKLTEEGNEHADEFRSEIMKESVVIRDGYQEDKVDMTEIDEYFDGDAVVEALSRVSGDGVIHLGDDFGNRFVNRDEELDTLVNCLNRVEKGTPHLVTVSGDAGIGKTTLVTEFEEIAKDSGFDILSEKCQSDIMYPYRPFIEIFGDYVGSDSLPPLFSSGMSDEIGIEDEEDFEAERTKKFNEVVEFVSDLDSKLVISIDDIHLADSATLDLFIHLVKEVEDTKVLFVSTYRGDEIEERHLKQLGERVGESRYTEIELDSFGQEETRGIIEWLMESREVPNNFVKLVYRKTGGNPLFIKESVKQMIERGVVDAKRGFFPKSEEEFPMPDSVENVINERLDSLDTESERILILGCLIGEKIPYSLLSAVSDLPEHEVRNYVDLLVDSQIWEEVRVSDEKKSKREIATGRKKEDDEREVLRFTTDVIRETVLGRIDDRLKNELHDRVAEKMRDYFESDLEYEKIARHYEEADELDEAVEYYMKSAEGAKEVYANEVAIENYEKALELTQELDGYEDEKLSILEDMGYVYFISGEFDEAERCFEFVGERSEEEEVLRRVRRYQAKMCIKNGEFDKGEEYIEKGLNVGGDKTVSEEVCALLGLNGWIKMRRGELDNAEEWFDSQLGMAEGLGDKVLKGKSLHNLGTVYYLKGNIEEAIKKTQSSIEISEETPGDLLGLSSSLVNLGAIYWKAGDLDAAQNALERSLEIKREIGDDRGIIDALTNLGLISQKRGYWERALEYYEDALDMSRELGDKDTPPVVFNNIGDIWLNRGDLEKAFENFEKSLEAADEIDDKRQKTLVNNSLIEVKILQDRLDEAEEIAEENLELTEEIGDEETKAGAMHMMGDVYYQRGDYEKASEYHEEAVETAMDLDSPERLAKARYALAEDYLEEGRSISAEIHAKKAIENAEEVSQPHLAQRAERVLGKYYRKNNSYAKAEAELKSALETAQELGVKIDEIKILHELGKLHKNMEGENDDIDHLENARECFDEASDIIDETGAVILKRENPELHESDSN